MNVFGKLLTPDRTESSHTIDSSKQIFQQLSGLLATSTEELDAESLFEAFIQREKLGSTYIGYGVAIPHLRSNSVQKPYGALIHLSKGIDFNQDDAELVDLFFGFIVPIEDNEQHLSILAALAEKFNDPLYRNQLRETANSNELFANAIK